MLKTSRIFLPYYHLILDRRKNVTTCRSDGANALYITFFYKHFTPTGLFFKKLNCYIIFSLNEYEEFSIQDFKQSTALVKAIIFSRLFLVSLEKIII